MNEDIYTIEKRNEMIQKAIKSYKFNELDLKINDWFAIEDQDNYIFSVYKQDNKLLLLMAEPEDFLYHLDDAVIDNINIGWIVQDIDLKYFLDLMSEDSYAQKRLRHNIWYALKMNGSLGDAIYQLSYLLKEKNPIINLAIFFDILFRNKGFNYIKMEELFALKNIITFLKGMAGH